MYMRMLEWRGIDPVYNDDVVCPACGGSGVKSYTNTTTWHGGIGGQQCTSDVCDDCWGSGKQNKPGVDLRKLFSKLRTLSEDKKST
jgi:RecJ-like exonuclease